jgi:hypothetical protein
MPYEVEFNMANASDCSYWLENHAWLVIKPW